MVLCKCLIGGSAEQHGLLARVGFWYAVEHTHHVDKLQRALCLKRILISAMWNALMRVSLLLSSLTDIKKPRYLKTNSALSPKLSRPFSKIQDATPSSPSLLQWDSINAVGNFCQQLGFIVFSRTCNLVTPLGRPAVLPGSRKYTSECFEIVNLTSIMNVHNPDKSIFRLTILQLFGLGRFLIGILSREGWVGRYISFGKRTCRWDSPDLAVVLHLDDCLTINKLDSR